MTVSVQSVVSQGRADREAYEREGWLLVRQLVTGERLRQLHAATVGLEQAARHLLRDARVRGVFFEVQSASGRKGERAVFPGALRKITSPSKGEPAFARLRRDSEVLAAAQRCGLVSPVCLLDQVNFKLPRVGTCFPYHQDERFLIGDAKARVHQYGGLNLVVALDATDAENGGFQVLGRTHRGQLGTDRYEVAQMNHGVFDESHRQIPSLSPGDAVLFHPRLAHGSGPNRSARPRRLVTLWLGGGPSALE